VITDIVIGNLPRLDIHRSSAELRQLLEDSQPGVVNRLAAVAHGVREFGLMGILGAGTEGPGGCAWIFGCRIADIVYMYIVVSWFVAAHGDLAVMLSRTSHYALRALICLTRDEAEWPISGVRLAREADIPAKYLSKVLGDLVRSGVLIASPGRTGGFRLRRSADQTRLVDVLAPFEHFERRECPFGNQECSDERPCNAHDAWKEVVAARQTFLRETTIHDVAFAAEERPQRRGPRRGVRRVQGAEQVQR
jgi:Rrf2 family protein